MMPARSIVSHFLRSFMVQNNASGPWGELVAAKYLKKKHYKIIATNYRCKFGEIDIIAANREFLVFVEVKTRKNDEFAAAAAFVDIYKQNRLRSTAELYLAANPTDLQPRFDVIEVYAPFGTATKRPEINHLEDVF